VTLQTDASAGARGYDPVDFQRIYDAGATPTGAQTTLGIVTEGDLTPIVPDLRTFEGQNNLVQVPVQVVQVGTQGTDTSGDIEWDLDTQTSTAVAGEVQNLMLYNATSLSMSDLTLAFNRAVTDNQAQVVSVSIAFCESFAQAAGLIDADDQIFAEAVAQGQTFVFGSGDGGDATPCVGWRQTSKYIEVSYPASSPYAIGAGGTVLATNADGSYAGETGWHLSGGGQSRFESQPLWQQGVVPGTQRGVPDVAFDAAQASGAAIIVSGRKEVVGGTSLATPLFAGVLARNESAHANGVGFAAPKIYAMAIQAPNVFHDVTSGSNGQFNAGPGWDYVTGWGSVDISRFVDAN
jgi:pseudomonalisin/xanthomonalisin